MVRKTKWMLGITGTFGSQGVLIPILHSKDSKISTVTLAGSSSLFDPFESLNDKTSNSKVDISILPTGSAWGREALEKKQIDLSLTSTSRENAKKENELFLDNLLDVFVRPEENSVKEWKLVEDPVVLLYITKNKNCQIEMEKFKKWNPKYISQVLSILFGVEEISEEENNKFPCFKDWVGFSREGKHKRSSINKVLFLKKNKNDEKMNLLKFREIPENNYLAIEFLRREAHSNSLIAIPQSFYKVNKEYLENIGFNYLSTSYFPISILTDEFVNSFKRNLNFELQKNELKEEAKKEWINETLTHYANLESKFNLKTVSKYFDKNFQCIDNYGLDLPIEVHSVTVADNNSKKNIKNKKSEIVCSKDKDEKREMLNLKSRSILEKYLLDYLYRITIY